MRRTGSIVASIAGTALLLLAAATSWAHTLTAPDSVRASPDGSFSYRWVFRVGPGTAWLAAAGWYGIDNVPGGMIGDCFCTPSCVLAEGDSVSWEVRGQLSNPAQAGLVTNWVSLCDAGGVSSPTRIVPAEPLAVDGPDPDGGPVGLVNRPNPFASQTTFHYTLSTPGRVTLRIFDIAGRRLATLWSGFQDVGAHSLTWSRHDAIEGPRAPGVYFAQLDVDGVVRDRRMVIAY